MVLFVIFEYNWLVFGVLKNVIDIGLCLYGDSVFVGKLVVVIGVFIG